jgi:hypothetical protein
LPINAVEISFLHIKGKVGKVLEDLRLSVLEGPFFLQSLSLFLLFPQASFLETTRAFRNMWPWGRLKLFPTFPH